MHKAEDQLLFAQSGSGRTPCASDSAIQCEPKLDNKKDVLDGMCDPLVQPLSWFSVREDAP